MITLLLIRHGQTDANAQGVLQGQSPTSLNALGREQAARLAERLAVFAPPVTRVVTSDLPRAAETADAIARPLGVTPEVDAAWRERGFGALEGQAIGELEIWRAASGAIDPPGAESLAVLDDRIDAAIRTLVARASADASIVVVSHGGVIRSVLRMLAGGRLPLAPGQPVPAVVPIANASILYLTVGTDASRWSVVRVNDVDHLDLVTTSDLG